MSIETSCQTTNNNNRKNMQQVMEARHHSAGTVQLLPRQSLTSASPKPHKNQTNPLMKHLSTSAPLNSAAVAMPEAVHGASVSQELSYWGGVQLLPATGFHMFHHRFRFADDREPTPVHEWVVTFMSCGYTPCPSAE